MSKSNSMIRGLTAFLGCAGLCITIAGVLLFYFLKNITFSVQIHVGLGIILMLIGILSNNKVIWFYLKSPRGVALISSALLFFLSIYIIICINFIAFKHRIRYDYTSTNKFTLSDKTIKILKTINGPLNFIVNENIPENSLRDLNELINQYQYHCPNILVRRYNPLKNPEASANIQREISLKPSHLLIVTNDIKGTHIDKAPLIEGDTEKISWFKGEQAILNAILTTTSRKVNKLYFLQGHGETSFNETDLQKTNILQLKNWLMTENFALQDINLLNTDEGIPSDCDALAILNPMAPLAPDEINKLDEYLSKENKSGFKGRLFVAIGANLSQLPNGRYQWIDTNIETLLLKHGIIIENKLVIEPELTIKSMGFFSIEIPFTNMYPHSITKPFIYNSHALHWGEKSRSIAPNPVPDKKIFFNPLLTSSEKCKSILDITTMFNSYKSKKLNEFLSEREGKRVYLAACTGELNPNEKKESYTEDDVLPLGTKIIAVGNGSFLNSPIKETDRDLFINSIRWLTAEREMIGNGANITQKVSWKIPADKEWFYREIIFYLMPLFWIFIGGFVWWVRKS